MEVAGWLRGLGLERYEQAFRDNDIDARVLPRLTADDLIAIGVISVGHRRRLLDGIAYLSTSIEPAEGVASPVTAERQMARTVEAERRQLTVMFVDLVNSTALARRLDPEDTSRVFRAYQECCAEMVKRWSGHVAKYMGDGVLAYFGWPQAHEDAAERAVRAELGIVGVISKLMAPGDEPLAARIGIATGLVVVGDLVGEGAAQEQTVVGETPNLAERLQNLAEPGRIVVAENTRQLLGGLFEFEDLGLQTLKGFPAGLRAFRVHGEGKAESRFEALHAGGLTPLVGREQEFALLLERWERAKDGEGQVILLDGEPGIGKSRLVRALRERLADELYTPLVHYCSPYHTNSALFPVIGRLERAARFGRDDTTEIRLKKLEAVLTHSPGDDETVPLIASLLSIPTGDRYPLLNLTPQRQKQHTLKVLAEQVAGLCRERPVLAVYEDVHWIDPSTLELLGLIIELVQRLSALVLITFRPELDPPWTGFPHVARLSLSRLTRRHGSAMILGVTGGKMLPAEVVEQIVSRTDGVPLFVEQLTKAVLESDLLRSVGDHFELAGPLPRLAIPATLNDSLMVRLDRIGPVKEIAQIGAVIGREFSREQIAAVIDRSEKELDQALDQLVNAELVFRRGAPPDAVYSFKHSFVQEAAYRSLLKSRRQQIHAKVAGALRERFPELIDSQPEILAHHLTEAGLTAEALGGWQRAGQLAAERSANAEAAAHFHRGLELLRRLPESIERNEKELDLLTTLGSLLMSTKGHSHGEVATVYGRARDLCRSVGDASHLAPVLQGLRLYHMVRADLASARMAAQELLALGESTRESGYLVEGHRAIGVVLFYGGEFQIARNHLERGVALYDIAAHGRHALRYAEDPGQVCLSFIALTLWMLGYPDQAVVRSEKAIAIAQANSHAESIAEAMICRAEIALLRRDIQDARERAVAALAVATEHGMPIWTAIAACMHGWALSEHGQGAEGAAQIREGLSGLARTADQLYRPYYLARLAEALGKTGQVDEALSDLDEAIESSRQFGVPYLDSELQRRKGELLLLANGFGPSCRRSLFPCSHRRSSSPEFPIAGAACHNQSRSVTHRPGQMPAGLRPALTNLQLVHRGL